MLLCHFAIEQNSCAYQFSPKVSPITEKSYQHPAKLNRYQSVSDNTENRSVISYRVALVFSTHTASFKILTTQYRWVVSLKSLVGL